MKLSGTVRLRGKAFLFSAALLAVIFSSNLYSILSLYHLHRVFVGLKDRTVKGLLSVSSLQHDVARALPDEKQFLFFTPIPPVAQPHVFRDLNQIRQVIIELPAPTPQAGFLIRACLTDLLEYQKIVQQELDFLKSGKREQAIRLSQTRSSALLIHFASLLQELRFEFNRDLARTVTGTAQEQERMTTVSVELTAVGILLVLLLLWAFSNMVLTPIMGLIAGTKRIAGGVFVNPVTVTGADELGDLARALNEMALKLGELNRMKSEFVTIASHELRTPLTSIRGFLSMLQRGKLGSLTPEQEKSLSIVREEVDHLVELVNGLLDLGRIESGQMPLEIQDVDLKALIERISERHHLTAEQSGTRFQVVVDPELPRHVRTDPGKVTQVLENLLANAFKFTSAGEDVELRVFRFDNHLEIEVKDTGIGIPPENIPFLFEKFYQVAPFNNRTREGLGLGLAITRGIVLTMGGHITVRQNQPRGTAFLVTIPFEPLTQDFPGRD